VKRTCLMTLTFLILAGQVKVKGQLSEMAKCIEDGDDRIRDMSRMFFSELAGKDNAVYNQFVDMFSLLSTDESLEEDQFKKIIRFLATFIEKVRERFSTLPCTMLMNVTGQTCQAVGEQACSKTSTRGQRTSMERCRFRARTATAQGR